MRQVVAPERARLASMAHSDHGTDRCCSGVSVPFSIVASPERVARPLSKNRAAAPVVVKLEPGRTAHDFLTFLQQPAGAPPGTMIGGVTWLSQGESNVITLEFEAGEYALLCFVPDEGDGQLHLAHGMIRQFRVE
jgi:hypothetical protein